MSITSIIVAWLFLMAAYMLVWKFRDDRLHGKNFFNFGDYNFLVASVTALGICWAVFNFFSPEPRFDSPQEQQEFAEKTRQPWLVTDAVWKKIEADSATPDDHFALVENHFSQHSESFTAPDVEAYNREGAKIFNYYTDLCEKNNPVENDIGNLMLALDYIESGNEEDLDAAAFHLRQVENRSIKYLNYLEGKLLLYQVGTNGVEFFSKKKYD